MTKKTFDYTTKQQQLNELVTQLEAGSLSLDEAMAAYEKGLALAKELEAYLKTAENGVRKLMPEV